MPAEVADTGNAATNIEKTLTDNANRPASATRRVRECDVLRGEVLRRNAVTRKTKRVRLKRPCMFFMMFMLAEQHHFTIYANPTATQFREKVVAGRMS